MPNSNYKFESHYCDKLIKHMDSGLTFNSFAGVISVAQSTIYEWLKAIPEFKEAYEIGQAKSHLFWDKLGLAGTAGKIKGFNAQSYKFNMMNRHKWSEKQKVEVSGNEGGPVRVNLYLPDNGRGLSQIESDEESSD